jgi:hypothetical protein
LSAVAIFLDESGDFGWKFDKPYGNGGSSRYLTIGAAIVTHEKRHIINRFVKDLYRKFAWNARKEKKWSAMNRAEKSEFLQRVETFASKEASDIQLFAITVNKERVGEHIKADPHKLYNYMIKFLLSEKMSEYDQVFFFPDTCSVKAMSGHSLTDYLQTTLWFDLKAKTILKTRHLESSHSLGVQFADMLSGLVQSCFERENKDAYKRWIKFIRHKKLYFV